jgi:hypothetical protein
VHFGFSAPARAPVFVATVFTALKAFLKRLRPVTVAAALFRSARPEATPFISLGGALSSRLRGGLHMAFIVMPLEASSKRLWSVAVAAAFFRSALPVRTLFFQMGAFSAVLRGGLRALFVSIPAEMRSRPSRPAFRRRFPTRALFSLLAAPVFAASLSARFPAWPFSRVLATPIVPRLCTMPGGARFP